MLPFLRPDLSQLVAYTPHPGGAEGSSAESTHSLDRLDTNENPYDLPADLKQKLTWQFQQEIESNRYPDGSHAALKSAIAEYVTESAQLPAGTITCDRITVGNGSDELIRSLLIATCLGNNGSILVADPTFSMYGIIARTLGITVHSVGRNEQFEMDIAAAQQVITSAQTPPVRMVFVVHPNSPTANALTEAELNWLRNLSSDILVVIDEAYFEFSQQTLVGELHHRSNWIIMRTFSKAIRLAAHRIGYAIAHPELIATLEKVRLPYNLPAFTQAAALVALSHRAPLLEVIPLLLRERDRLMDALLAQPNLQVWPSQANFIFVRLKNGSPDQMQHMFETLRQQGTLIRYTCGGFRITVGTPEENARSIDRLSKLLAVEGTYKIE